MINLTLSNVMWIFTISAIGHIAALVYIRNLQNERANLIHDIEQEVAAHNDALNPRWVDFIALCHRWLTKYPEDIFDGSSGDSGPVFVTTLRDALRTLDEVPSRSTPDREPIE